MSKNMAVISDTGLVDNIIVCQDNQPETPNLITYTDANPAYIGGTFDSGYFYPPQPYPSWSKDGVGGWDAPVSMPDGGRYQWDEDSLGWVELID